MTLTRKVLTLTLVVLLLLSIFTLTIASTNVQAATKPSVPQFTVKLVDNSYDVPSTTTTTTNPYTGEETTTITPGYRIENKTVEVTIKNQFFTPYTNADGYECGMYYRIEYKGHFSDEWQNWGPELAQSNSQNTTSIWRPYYPFAVGDQVDFRVEATYGHYVIIEDDTWPWWMSYPKNFVIDVSSGWSEIQMFIMPGESSLSSPSQTITWPETPAISDSNQPQQSAQTQPPKFVFYQSFLLWVGALLFVGVVIAVVIVFTKRHLKFKH